MNLDLTYCKAAIKTAKNISIVTHPSPDGDAMGSSLGLYHAINMMFPDQKNINVIVPNSIPEYLHFLPGTDKVKQFDIQTEECTALLKNSEIIFILDFNSIGRIGELGTIIEETLCFKIMIDHHMNPDPIADLIISDTDASSTCQMMYRFLIEMFSYMCNENLQRLSDIFAIFGCKDIVTCLYTGIVTDSGSFKFPRTNSELHEIAADLIKCGADNVKIHADLYNNGTLDQMKLTSYILSNKMEILPEYNASILSMSLAEKQSMNYRKGDTEGVVNVPLSCKEISLSIFVTEDEEGKVRMSFRSKGVKIAANIMAKEISNGKGGGHFNAAGASSDMNLQDTIDHIKRSLENYKDMFS